MYVAFKVREIERDFEMYQRILGFRKWSEIYSRQNRIFQILREKKDLLRQSEFIVFFSIQVFSGCTFSVSVSLLTRDSFSFARFEFLIWSQENKAPQNVYIFY